MNKKDSTKRADEPTAKIRSKFGKTSSEIEEERENSKSSTSSSFFQKLKKKFSFSSNSFKTFDGEKPLTSTPVAHRTRARAPRGYVDLSKIKTNRTYALSVKKEETSESEEE